MKQIELLKKWILYSGIQNKDGSFNAWYDLDTKKYPYKYSEITGYGITTLLNLGETKKAEKAANWLIENALHQSGGIKTKEYYSEENADPSYSFWGGRLFTFDTGVVLWGISNLYNKTKKEEYYDAIIKMANFILKAQQKGGWVYAFYEPVQGQYGSQDDKWSNVIGSFNAKIAMGLLNTHAITKDDIYKKGAQALCGYSLRHQDDYGRFISLYRNCSTNQHPHCYAVEGLFANDILTSQKKYFNPIINAVKWSFESQLKNGGIPQIYNYNGFIKYERMDINAQVLRLGCMVNKHIKDGTIPEAKLEKLKNRLLSFQKDGGDQKGGMYYGYGEGGEQYRHINSWCSMFALQALSFYEDRKKIRYMCPYPWKIAHLKKLELLV